ncbi:hypothetical protein E2C01_018337 [Portunus trituberculatus]|uniref:Integrase zinc-binding domain-containing protein n=1 Tax=Portunus trituberculatus TaxID=210409 RepID=A0A5B7DU87_PORTR|nr:hypothetical protein [Portunus trituberculatus]
MLGATQRPFVYKQHVPAVQQSSSLHPHDSRSWLSPLAAPYRPPPLSNSHHPRFGIVEPERKWAATKRENEDAVNQAPREHLQRYSVSTRGFCYTSTALVVAVNGPHTRLVQLLIDGESDSSYIRSSVANYLNLPVTDSDTFACVGFQEKIENIKKYDQAINRLAWIRRFTHNARCQAAARKTGPLTPEERRDPLHYWIFLAQNAFYCTELDALRHGTSLQPHSPVSRLRPFLDKHGLIRTTLRTNEPSVITLPDLSYITTLIVDEAHRRCFHQSTRTTLALLSAEYMIRRKTVLRVVSSCGRCKRYRSLPYSSPEASLPDFRTEPTRPFSRIGLDYFGPIYVDAGERRVWGLLLT